jgi:hypothetical protein
MEKVSRVVSPKIAERVLASLEAEQDVHNHSTSQ